MLRTSPQWRLLQLNLPPLLPSSVEPLSPNLCSADIYERALLTLEAKEWDSIEAVNLQAQIANEDGPVVTGDPIVDELERKLWEAKGKNG